MAYGIALSDEQWELIAAMGGAIVIVDSLLMAIGLVAFSVAPARSRLLPSWLFYRVGRQRTQRRAPWLYEATLQGALFGAALVLLGVTLATRSPHRRSKEGSIGISGSNAPRHHECIVTPQVMAPASDNGWRCQIGPGWRSGSFSNRLDPRGAR